MNYIRCSDYNRGALFNQSAYSAVGEGASYGNHSELIHCFTISGKASCFYYCANDRLSVGAKRLLVLLFLPFPSILLLN